MSTVTITSQGQITIPAFIRKRWGITGSARVTLNFDEASDTITLHRKPTVDEVIRLLHQLPRDRDVEPLLDVHGFYESGRSKELADKLA